MDEPRNPLLKRRTRKPTEAELLAWKSLSRDPGLPWDRLPDPCPYVKLRTPDGRPGIEIGINGTF